MIRILVVLFSVAMFGAAKLPVEHAISAAHRDLHFRTVDFNLSLREQIGQLGFIAALSGFRSLVADVLFIQAHVAWERTEWGRVLLLFRQVTTLQPRAILFWDMAAWHMAWNASTAAMNDPAQPRLALRLKAQREYLELGKDFLERGIRNNPERPQLYEAMARLYRDKYDDHEHAAEFFSKAAALPDAPSYAKRFAAYELAQCAGREREAYDRLLALYEMGEKERLPTLLRRLKQLENKLDIPLAQRIPDRIPLIIPMRFAIFSDLHANLEATNAVLADAHERGCTEFVCLGDVVGYNANPHECVEIVQKMACPVVKGNHDEQASLEESSRDFNPLAEMAINWTREQLTKEDKAWLRALRLSRQVRDFTIVHATLDTPEQWGYVFNDLDAAASFTYQHTTVCFFGHTHVAGAFVRDDGVKRVRVEQLMIEETKKYFINVGSVGQPRDGDWRAAYCIYDVEKKVVEQRRLKYDVATAQQKIIKAGLPKLLADRLKLGR